MYDTFQSVNIPFVWIIFIVERINKVEILMSKYKRVWKLLYLPFYIRWKPVHVESVSLSIAIIWTLYCNK